MSEELLTIQAYVTVVVHTCLFLRLPRIESLKASSLPKTDLDRKKLTPDGKSHGLGIQPEFEEQYCKIHTILGQGCLPFINRFRPNVLLLRLHASRG